MQTKKPPQQFTASTAQQIPKDSSSHAAAEPGAKESQLATKFKGQQHKSRSDELWNDAYDKLEVEEGTAKVTDAYRNTLAELLTDEKLKDPEFKNASDTTATGASDVSTVREDIKTKILEELKDRTNRQVYMAKLVKEGLEKVAKASKITKRVGDFANTILQAKPVADIILQIPQAAPAALPWAGIYIGLQVSGHHFKCNFRVS